MIYVGLWGGAMAMKCSSCGCEFDKYQRAHGRCKPCKGEFERNRSKKYVSYRKELNLKKKYGVSLEEFNKMIDDAGNRCGICGVGFCLPVPQVVQPGNIAVVDHDHKTGRIRGLLCKSCNVALGMFCDDPTRLRNAAKWIESHVDDLSFHITPRTDLTEAESQHHHTHWRAPSIYTLVYTKSLLTSPSHRATVWSSQPRGFSIGLTFDLLSLTSNGDP
jgi:hypothetical protein